MTPSSDPVDDTTHPRLSSGQETVGAALARARMAHGTTLREASGSLRIREEYLDAIEQGRFDDLPGMTYAIGYVRSYAQSLGLDATDIVARFKAEADAINARPELAFPSPAPEGKVPGGAVLFVSLLLATVAYGGWYWATTSDRSVASFVPAIPDSLSSLLSPAGETAADNGETTTVTTPAHAETTPESSNEPAMMAASAAPAVSGGANLLEEEAVAEDLPTMTSSAEATVSAPTATPLTGNEAEGLRRRVGSTDRTSVQQPQIDVSETAPTTDEAATSLTATNTATGTTTGTGTATDTDVAVLAETSADVAEAVEAEVPVAPTPDQTERLTSVMAALRTAPSSSATEEDTTAESNLAETVAPGETASVSEVASVLPLERPTDSAPASFDAASATDDAEDSSTAAIDAETVAPDESPSAPLVTVASLPPPPSIPAAPSVNRSEAPVDGARVVIRATSDSWVQVRDARSAPIMTRVMRAGDVYRVPARAGLRLSTGNAGALEILLDGDPIAKIGAFGQIARDIQLDPTALAAR